MQDVSDMVTAFGKIPTPSQTKDHTGALALSFTFRYPAVAVLRARFSDQGGRHGRPGAVSDQTGSSTEGADD